MSDREFWFSQALEDAEGEQWPPGCDLLCDEFDHLHFHSDGGLIERQGHAYFAEGYLRPAHELAEMPADAVRLAPEGHADLDAQDRDQSYARGFSDGVMAARAGNPQLPEET